MSEVHVVVLAAGKGTRMKSSLPKVLHRVAGRPLIEHVLASARSLAPATLTVVVGHQAEALTAALASQADLTFVVQEPQLGTAHALLTTEPALAGHRGTLVLLSGDVPLLSPDTLKRLVTTHLSKGAAATVVTATLDDPHGYGRVVREGARGEARNEVQGDAQDGRHIAQIVEEKDATPAQREIKEINAGIYAFNLGGLFDAVRSIAADNTQREYYLPDLVSIYRSRGAGVETLQLEHAQEILGINTRAELATVNAMIKMAKNAALMAAGVTIDDPATTYIEEDVQIGPDTVIHPGVSIERGSIIGRQCEIHSGARIVHSTLGDRVVVLNHCVISDSQVRDAASIGPFAHLRGHADVGAGAKVGNFVELKKAVLGAGTKAGHLAYLGDAMIGAGVNIGAGTITCNYDGRRKHTTTIEDGAFIGSDTQLVAPVTIGEGAYVGSGSTIREDVPPGALAVSAGQQRNFEGWAERRKNT